MENFGKFMTIVLVMIISPIIKGFVLAKLWLWFIVPVFQVHQLRLVEAIGIMFLIDFLLVKRIRETNNEKFWEELGKNIMFVVLSAIFVLLSSWVVTLFL